MRTNQEDRLKTDSKTKVKNILLFLIPILVLAAVLHFMFQDSYREIIKQLTRTKWEWLIPVLLFGISYYFCDAVGYYLVIRKRLYGFSFQEAIQIIFLGWFFNVATFGTGIKPAQAYFLHKKGIEPGQGLAIVTVPYIYHKLTVVLYATIMLILKNDFIKSSYSSSYHYIYAGYGVSLLVMTILVLLYISEPFHRLIFCLLDKMISNKMLWNKLLKKEQFKDRINRWEHQITGLRIEATKMVCDWKMGLELLLVNAVKLSCWFVIPMITLYATGAKGITTFSWQEIIATSSFMQLIVGVIPTSGGMVSTEVVYTLLYGQLFGKISAGTTMLLYRVATYYIPFLVSIIYFLYLNYKRLKLTKRST